MRAVHGGSPRQGSAAAAAAVETWATAVKRSVLLRKLPAEVLGYVQRSCKSIKVQPNQAIFTQGEPSVDFYVVQTGRYRVTITGPDGETQQLVREYDVSDAFGSHELLAGGNPPRKATVTALEAGALWLIPGKVFDSKLRFAPVPAPSLVDKVRQLSIFEGLPTEQLTLLCRAVTNVTVDKGKTLHCKGDEAREVIALVDGKLKALAEGGGGKGDGEGSGKQIVEAPCCFGQEAFHPDEEYRVRAADVAAWAGKAVLMTFSVYDVEALLGYMLQRKVLQQANLAMLRGVMVHKTPLLDGLTPADCEWLSANIVHERPYSDGEVVVAEGAGDERLYIVRHGQVAVVTEELGEAGVLETGQYFGELALTGRKHKRSATMKAKGGEKLQLVSLSMSVIRTNPKLEWWTKNLDVAAAAAAVAEGTGSSQASKAKPRKFSKDMGKDGKTEKQKEAELAELMAKSQMAKRRSFGEMMVEGHRKALNAAKRAARDATATARRNQKNKQAVGAHEAVREVDFLGAAAPTVNGLAHPPLTVQTAAAAGKPGKRLKMKEKSQATARPASPTSPTQILGKVGRSFGEGMLDMARRVSRIIVSDDNSFTRGSSSARGSSTRANPSIAESERVSS